jgi:hypothetical protein
MLQSVSVFAFFAAAYFACIVARAKAEPAALAARDRFDTGNVEPTTRDTDFVAVESESAMVEGDLALEECFWWQQSPIR